MAEILHQLRLVVCPIVYRVSYIPGGARFEASTVELHDDMVKKRSRLGSGSNTGHFLQGSKVIPSNAGKMKGSISHHHPLKAGQKTRAQVTRLPLNLHEVKRLLLKRVGDLNIPSRFFVDGKRKVLATLRWDKNHSIFVSGNRTHFNWCPSCNECVTSPSGVSKHSQLRTHKISISYTVIHQPFRFAKTGCTFPKKLPAFSKRWLEDNVTSHHFKGRDDVDP